MAKKKKTYELTPEHRAQLAPWVVKWILNAMSTKAMDDADRAAMVDAIEGLYRAANLLPPPRRRIVFVSSPLVGTIAAGFAAAIWHLRATYDATRAATYDATYDATTAATDDATRAATYDATDAATDAATYDATRAATYDATYDATRAATYDATDAATYDATDAATYVATRAATTAATNRAIGDGWTQQKNGWAIRIARMFGPEDFLCKCAQSAWKFRDGGNHWSAWPCFLSFFRHVAKLDLDYSKWQHYEAAAMHGSWRWMHKEFCIISDRPKTIRVDAQNRPHCDDGPSHEWRDGWRLYHWHGLRVPDEFIERRKTNTAAWVKRIANVEQRRAAMEIYAHAHGADAFVRDLGAKLVARDEVHGQPRTIYEADGARYVHVVNGSVEPDGTRRAFLLGAPVDAQTPHDAIAWTYGINPKIYNETIRT